MALWTPGWSSKGPDDDDLVLAIDGDAVLKPDAGWLKPWRMIAPSTHGGMLARWTASLST